MTAVHRHRPEAVRDAVVAALRQVADPCCRERGISVVDMGLLRDLVVHPGEDRVEIDLLLTSGWCPFQVDLLAEVTRAAEQVPGVERAVVRIRLDDTWSAERLSPSARRALRFLPDPVAVGDRGAYLMEVRRDR
jgi:metal-sulfur cluster biosynthetic enzyme